MGLLPSYLEERMEKPRKGASPEEWAVYNKYLERIMDPNYQAYQQISKPQFEDNFTSWGGSGPGGRATAYERVLHRINEWKHGLLVPPGFSSRTGGKI